MGGNSPFFYFFPLYNYKHLKPKAMYYEINVALNGSHFFATAKRSITCKDKLKVVLKKLRESFTKEEGYSINISYCPEVEYGFRIEHTTEEVEVDEMIKRMHEK